MLAVSNDPAERLQQLRQIKASGKVHPAVIDYVKMLIAETERSLGLPSYWL